jgi:hypothetical protein
MLANRLTLKTMAAIAVLAIAGSTTAQAGGRFGSQFCHRGFGNVARPHIANATPYRNATKVVTVRPKAEESRPHYRAASSQVVKPATGAAAAVGSATAPTCLTKEYLDTGAVMFRDTCTKEWAVNSTEVATKASAVAPTCLRKENNQGGVIMFRDACTNEWAMNTLDQLAEVRATQ